MAGERDLLIVEFGVLESHVFNYRSSVFDHNIFSVMKEFLEGEGVDPTSSLICVDRRVIYDLLSMQQLQQV